MRRVMLLLVLIAVIGAAAAYVFVWRPNQAGEAPEQEARSAVVERGDMLVAVSASGRVEPQKSVNLAFQIPGRVAEVRIEVGDQVRAGDMLARLDTAQLVLQMEQAQAALTSAEARLAQLRAGARREEVTAAEANLRATEAQVEAASANLAQLYAGANDAQIAAAEADLAAAMNEQKQAADMYDMVLKCFTFKIFGQEHEICPALGAPEEQARYNLNAADRSLAAAQARLDETLAGADSDAVRAARANVAAVEAQRDAAQAQLDLLQAGPTGGQIAAAEAQVAQAQAALALAELSVEKAALYAPFDGVVATVNVEPGEMNSGGSLPAFSLLDVSEFQVALDVDELDVGLLAPGQAAQVTLDALPEVEIPGHVERVAPAATVSGGVVNYHVIADLDPTDAPVRADMTVNVTIVVNEFTGVLKIPTWVVHVDRDTGQTYVNRRVGEETVRTDVVLGVRHAGVVQVLDGLSEGDKAIWIQESSAFGFGGQ
jgi:HlyD family secretion protein